MPLIFKNSMQRKVIYGRDGDENGLFHEFRAATRAQDRSLSTRQTAIQQIVLSGVTPLQQRKGGQRRYKTVGKNENLSGKTVEGHEE